MKSDFVLYNKIIYYDKYVRRYLPSVIPSVYRDLRIHLFDENYNLIKYLYKVSYTKGNIKNKYITEMLVTISLIDYLLSTILDFCPKGKKYITKSIGMLTEIKNIIYALKRNSDKSAKT